MNTIKYILPLAILLSACKKEKDVPGGYASSDCMHMEVYMQLRNYTMAERDTLLEYKYTPDFSKLESVEMVNGNDSKGIHITLEEHSYMYVLPATRDTFQLSNIVYEELWGAPACRDKYKSVTARRNNVSFTPETAQTYIHELALYIDR